MNYKRPYSYYYEYEFVSPTSLFARVKEELKSFFESGAIDDLLFPIWADKCLQKLRRGSYKIEPYLMEIKDFQARLPDNFYAVREAWLCTHFTQSYQLPNADYQTVAISTRLDSPDVSCDICSECAAPDIVRAMYKTTNTILFEYRKSYLLTPGNLSIDKNCKLGQPYSLGHPCAGTFDVRGNKFTVDFREGVVHLIYYAKEYDSIGNQLIPDSFDIWEYIEAFLKYKIYEQLSNQVPDDKVRAMQEKRDYYDVLQREKFQIARTETMKEDVYKIQKAIKRTNHRNDKYIIS